MFGYLISSWVFQSSGSQLWVADSQTVFAKRYVNSSTTNDIVAIRINPYDGNITGFKFFRAAPASEFIYDVKSLPGRGYIIVGSTWSFSAGQDDYLVMFLDDTFGLKWSKAIGFSENDFYTSADMDGSGILVGGLSFRTSYWWNIFLVKFDTLGNIQWYRYFTTSGNYTDGVFNVLSSGDGYFWATGHVCVTSCKVLVLKISSTGSSFNYRIFNTSSNTETGFALLRYGTYTYVFGRRRYSSDSADILVFKLDNNLNILWGKVLSGEAYKEPQKAIIASDGNILLSGYKYVSPYAYLTLIKMDTAGNVIFSYVYDSIKASNTDKARIVENPDGTYTATFGSYMIKINPDGTTGCGYSPLTLTESPVYTTTGTEFFIGLSDSPIYQTPFFTYTPDTLPYAQVCPYTYTAEKDNKFSEIEGVYSVDGRYLGKDIKGLRKGVYFIRRGGEVKKVIVF